MIKRTRVKPTKMWAALNHDKIIHEVRMHDSFHHWYESVPVMVLDYRDYLVLKRAAKGGKR